MKYWQVFLNGEDVGVIKTLDHEEPLEVADEFLSDRGFYTNNEDVGVEEISEEEYLEDLKLDMLIFDNELDLEFPVAPETSKASDYDTDYLEESNELLEFVLGKEKLLDSKYTNGYRVTWPGGSKDIKDFNTAYKYAKAQAKVYKGNDGLVSLFGIVDKANNKGDKLCYYKRDNLIADNTDEKAKAIKAQNNVDKLDRKIAEPQEASDNVSISTEPAQTANTDAAQTAVETQPAQDQAQAQAQAQAQEQTPDADTSANTSTSTPEETQTATTAPEQPGKNAAAVKANKEHKKIVSALITALEPAGVNADTVKGWLLDGKKATAVLKNLRKALFTESLREDSADIIDFDIED